jgi:type I restriction enzyme R subunit
MSDLLAEIVAARGARAIEYEEYLRRIADLANNVVREIRPDGWRGIQARENAIKHALYGVLKDHRDLKLVFLIVKQQREY